MAILDKLLAIIGDMTNKLDEIAEEGYDLSDWRTQFIVIHAL